MQPYFLPYLGYFSLIAATDHFVSFDPVQYIRHGWINRNRILKPGFAEPQYIRVPVAKFSRDTIIKEIQISKNADWQGRILGQIQHYKKKAPNFQEAKSVLEKCLAIETESLVDLNVHSLKVICNHLGLHFSCSRFDDIEGVAPAQHAGEWALNIADALDASTYINPVGGRDIFEPEQFSKRNINLQFLENALSPYSQRNAQFVSGLSILDVLMFNDIENTRKLIDDYVLHDS